MTLYSLLIHTSAFPLSKVAIMALKNHSTAVQIEEAAHQGDTIRVDDIQMRGIGNEILHLTNLAADAKQATECEKNMTLKQSFWLYQKAAM